MMNRGVYVFGCAALMALTGICAEDVVLENDDFKLTIGADALVKSLVVKATGTETLRGDEEIPFLTSTQDRPFNNEIKLIFPNKRTTYSASSVKREGDTLVFGFDHRMYEAVVKVDLRPRYLAFTLKDLPSDRPKTYQYLRMDIPPVQTLRLVNLPVRNRKNFGDWLNASWDENAAVAVVGTSPYADIDSEKRKGYRLLTAELVRGQKLRGAGAAIIAAPGREAFLDAMAALEEDFNLPRGVKSRRSPHVNSSIFHTSGIVTPANYKEVLKYVKAGGFKYMTFNFADLWKAEGSWGLCGDYDWREEYPEGPKTLKAMLDDIKAQGIHPGLHTIHPHIGLKSRYVTPVADPRLNKTRRFTLAEALPKSTNDLESITVYETTADTTMFPACRILQFGGELLSYESYTTEPPYRFLKVKRCAHATLPQAHERGQVGGILDISEFGTPGSCYADQNSDLQEEVNVKMAEGYNAGFEYIYMDGSEGVNVPCNYWVSAAQYKLWKLLSPAPLFGEGAAKTHFDWHMLSGANAFDCFLPEQFKEKLIEYPLAQAPFTWQEMTRCNFGWWGFFKPHGKNVLDWYGVDSEGTQMDQWEFGQSASVAWRCPMTVQMRLSEINEHPRTLDILGAMARWEEYREKGLMTEAERAEILADYHQEHHLVRLPDGSLRMVKTYRLPDRKDVPVTAYAFEYEGATWVYYWHRSGSGKLTLDIPADKLALFGAFNKDPLDFERGEGKVTLPADNLRYFRTTLTREELKKIF